MKVGILELVALPSKKLSFSAFNLLFSKQYSGVTTQAVSVWCRQLGHDTYYNTYYGVGVPEKQLPDNLDIVFISCCSQFAPLAYALAKLYRKAGVTTVIGGAHAKSFPQDCSRFFDIVVKECNKNLIADILAGHFAPGSSISSTHSYSEVPSVEEREQEIRTASYFHKRWRHPVITTVPLLSSMGCPYTCNFCTDWNNPYQVLPAERLVADVTYIAKHLPGATILFHDPNFGVKFDTVCNALESIPTESQVPYLIECSLSILNESRLQRLSNTGCTIGLFAIESWNEYTNKAGVGRKNTAEQKMEKIAAQFEQIRQYIPYLQANFIFGVDNDSGEEPVTLTKEFMRRAPYVWPVLNMPVPFGGTPLQETMLAENRVLKNMPFNFYYPPFLVAKPKNYGIIDYFEKMIELSSFITSKEMSKLRMQTAANMKHKISHYLRSMVEKDFTRHYREVLGLLRTDKQFLDFHEGRIETLPAYYRQRRAELVGSYAELLSEEDWIPDLNYQEPTIIESNVIQYPNKQSKVTPIKPIEEKKTLVG